MGSTLRGLPVILQVSAENSITENAIFQHKYIMFFCAFKHYINLKDLQTMQTVYAHLKNYSY